MKIEDLIPLLKDGWVVMQASGNWSWHFAKPYIQTKHIIGDDFWENVDDYSVDIDYVSLQGCFDIEPVEDWRESLIQIKDGKGIK